MTRLHQLLIRAISGLPRLFWPDILFLYQMVRFKFMAAPDLDDNA